MRARAFFYACAGLLCLALAFHFGARMAGAQGGIGQEVAVLTGEVPHGGTIPLPRYADGSEALESDCSWTVSAKTLWGYGGPVYQRCSTEGRRVRVYWCDFGCGVGGPDCDPTPADCSPVIKLGVANYMIIAVRNSGTTSSLPRSFGQVKSRWLDRGAQQGEGVGTRQVPKDSR